MDNLGRSGCYAGLMTACLPAPFGEECVRGEGREVGRHRPSQEEARGNLRPVRGRMARIDTNVPADVDDGVDPQLRSPITTLKSCLTGGRHPSPQLSTLPSCLSLPPLPVSRHSSPDAFFYLGRKSTISRKLLICGPVTASNTRILLCNLGCVLY